MIGCSEERLSVMRDTEWDYNGFQLDGLVNGTYFIQIEDLYAKNPYFGHISLSLPLEDLCEKFVDNPLTMTISEIYKEDETEWGPARLYLIGICKSYLVFNPQNPCDENGNLIMHRTHLNTGIWPLTTKRALEALQKIKDGKVIIDESDLIVTDCNTRDDIIDETRTEYYISYQDDMSLKFAITRPSEKTASIFMNDEDNITIRGMRKTRKNATLKVICVYEDAHKQEWMYISPDFLYRKREEITFCKSDKPVIMDIKVASFLAITEKLDTHDFSTMIDRFKG